MDPSYRELENFTDQKDWGEIAAIAPTTAALESVEKLHQDVFYQILLNTDPEDLPNFCLACKKLMTIYNNQYFRSEYEENHPGRVLPWDKDKMLIENKIKNRVIRILAEKVYIPYIMFYYTDSLLDFCLLQTLGDGIPLENFKLDLLEKIKSLIKDKKIDIYSYQVVNEVYDYEKLIEETSYGILTNFLCCLPDFDAIICMEAYNPNRFLPGRGREYNDLYSFILHDNLNAHRGHDNMDNYMGFLKSSPVALKIYQDILLEELYKPYAKYLYKFIFDEEHVNNAEYMIRKFPEYKDILEDIFDRKNADDDHIHKTYMLIVENFNRNFSSF